MPNDGEIFFSVTLRIFGDNLIPDAVTSILSVAPTDSFQKGDPRTGRMAHTVRKYGFWEYRRDNVPRIALSDAVCDIAAIVPVRTLRSGSLKEYEIDVWISSQDMRSSNNGFQLDSKALKALADRDWTAVFDLYFDSDDSDPADSS